MKVDYNQLAEDMIKYRAKHNLTQDKLADLCMLSRDIIYKAEKGNANLRPTSYLKIVNVVRKE